MAAPTLDHITKRLAQQETLRRPHEATWRDSLEHCFPLRASGLQGSVLDAAQALIKKAELVDDTATDAGLILASGLMSGMTPANSRWFQMRIDGSEGVEGTDDEAENWLDDAADTMWQAIHASDYDSAGLECMLDMVGAGWFVLYIDEDQERGGYHFEQWALAQCYITASRKGGRVDTIYRKFKLSAGQAVDEYGDELSDDTKKLAREKPDEMVEFVHAIYPRRMYLPNAKLARNLPFASCHVEVKKKKIVREGGYHEFPCVVPRWRLIPDTHYGVGPMFDALPTARRLNKLARNEMSATDVAVAGMWIAEADGVLNPRTVKIGPRKIVVANSVDSMKALQTGADFNVAWTMQDRLQAQIRKILMADQLQPQDGPAMTATEVHARMALIRQLLGPIFGRLQAEFLQPMIERCFGIAYRAGALGQAPESIADRFMSIKYISPLARAQRLEDVTSMDGFELTLMKQAELDPGALDIYKWDDARRERAHLMGVPSKLLREEDDLAKVRADKEKQKQAAQQQAMGLQAQQSMIDAGAKQMAAA